MNRAAYSLSRTLLASVRLSTAPVRLPIQVLQPQAYLHTSKVLLGEPMKKKKKSDPQDAMLKLSKRAKKFEKAIKKLEKLGRRLKLVDEIEGNRQLRMEAATRMRDAVTVGSQQDSGLKAEATAASAKTNSTATAAAASTAPTNDQSEKSAKKALKKKKKAEKQAEEEALAKQSEKLSNVVRLSEAELERRSLLQKSWTRYQSELTARDDSQLRDQLRSVDRALRELKLTSQALYDRAIEVDPITQQRAVEDETIVATPKSATDAAKKLPEVAASNDAFSMLPFEGCGPALTRAWPSDLYEAPDGEYIDTTRNYELGIDVSIYVRSPQQKMTAKAAEEGGDED